MVDAIITGIFGLQAAAAPALSHSAPTVADPQVARGVEGTLTAVRWQGQLYNAVAGADGVRWTRAVQAATAISPQCGAPLHPPNSSTPNVLIIGDTVSGPQGGYLPQLQRLLSPGLATVRLPV